MLSQQGSAVSARTAGRDMIAAMFLAGVDRDRVLARAEDLSKPVDVLPVDAAARHLLRGQAVWRDRQPVSAGFLAGRDRQYPDPGRPGRRGQRDGKDPYAAFAIRFSLFVVVMLYAWVAIAALEWLRAGRRRKDGPPLAAQETQ